MRQSQNARFHVHPGIAGRQGVGKAQARVVDALADVAGRHVVSAGVDDVQPRVKVLSGAGLPHVGIVRKGRVCDGVGHARLARAAGAQRIQLAERAARGAAHKRLVLAAGRRIGLPGNGCAAERDLVDDFFVNIGREISHRSPQQHGLAGHPPLVGRIQQVARIDHGARAGALARGVVLKREVHARYRQRGRLRAHIHAGGLAVAAVGHGGVTGGSRAGVIDFEIGVVKPVAQAGQGVIPVAATVVLACAHERAGEAGHVNVPINQAQARKLGAIVEVVFQREIRRERFQAPARAFGINADVVGHHVAIFAVAAGTGYEHTAARRTGFLHLPARRGRDRNHGHAVSRRAAMRGVIERAGIGARRIAVGLIRDGGRGNGGAVGRAAADVVAERQVAAAERLRLGAKELEAVGRDARYARRRRIAHGRGRNVLAAIRAGRNVGRAEIRNARVGRAGVAGRQRGGAHLQRNQAVGRFGSERVAHAVHHLVVSAHDGIRRGVVQPRARRAVERQ